MLEATALQVQTSAIVQRLRMHTSMQPASVVPQAGNAGERWQSSILPRNSAAVRASQGIPGRAALMLPGQPRSAASRQPCWPALRAAWQGQHGSKPAAQHRHGCQARSRALHTDAKQQEEHFVPAAVSSPLPSKHPPASLGAEPCKDSGSTPNADQVSAASPFLSVVLEEPGLIP